MPVVSAEIITSITVYDYDGAISKLSLNFIFIIISTISYFAYYLVSKKVNKTISIFAHKYIYDNIKENKNITTVPSSLISNISSFVNFNKNFLYKICFFIKSIVLLSIIIYYNFFIGISLIFVSVVSFFLLKITDTKIQKNTLSLSKCESESLQLFNSIHQGVQVESDYNLEQVLKDKYFGYVDSEIKMNNKISLYYNINNNFISLILKTAVFVTTIFLINQVKATTLTLSLYLILTPYLTSSAQNLIAFFELFSEVGLLDNILLEFESLKFSTDKKEIKLNLSTYNLYFFETSASEKEHKLKNFNLKINFGSIINFVGERNSGKRIIFLLLQKNIKPSSGVILLDNKNIFDIDNETYRKTISFTTKDSFFYNVSIIENLLLVNPNRNQILSGIKSFGLKPNIDKLPNKLNTIVSKNLDDRFLFFLSILRSFISGSKIINIYECPESFNKSDYDKLSKIIKFLSGKTTLIFYTHKEILSEHINEFYYIENGEIKNIKK